VPESRPTEAFDSSFIMSAVQAAQDAKAKEEAAAGAPAAETTRDEPAAGSLATEAFESLAPAPAPVPADHTKLVEDSKASEDWFVAGSQLNEDGAFPIEDREGKKESRMFWVIVAAFAVLVAIGVAVWFDNRGEPPPAPEPPAQIAPAKGPISAPAPAPRVTAAPAPAPAPAPAVVAAPAPALAAATEARKPPPAAAAPAAPSKDDQIQAAVEKARQEFKAGHLQAAQGAYEAVVALEPTHAEAKRQLATIATRMKASEAAAARDAEKKAKEAEKAAKAAERKVAAPPPAEKKVEKVTEKKVEKPAEKPAEKKVAEKKIEKAPEPKKAEPQMTDEERQAKVQGLIRAGRDSYKNGDFQAAIAKYNQALSLDKANALIPKLLDQAKAKLGQ